MRKSNAAPRRPRSTRAGAQPPRGVAANTPATAPRRSSSRLDARYQKVLIALRRIMRASDMHSKRLARECGLTTPQIVTLQTVLHLGETTIGALSAHISLSQATLTTILDRLQDRGLLERYRSTVDRRVVHARLTPTGRRVVGKAPPLLHERFLRSFAALPASEQEHIVTTLERVATMLGADRLDLSPLLPATANPTGAAH